MNDPGLREGAFLLKSSFCARNVVFFCIFVLEKMEKRAIFSLHNFFSQTGADMTFRRTDVFEAHNGAFPAVLSAAVRIPAPICIASDALIAIIISQTAR